MDLFDLMAREHRRFDRDVARCLDTQQSSRLTGADCKAVRRLATYLAAQERALFPAMLALSLEAVDEPARRHQVLRAGAAETLLRCRRAGPDVPAALEALRRVTARHGSYELTQLRARLAALFTENELREIAGAMRLELLSRRAEHRPQGAAATVLHLVRRRFGPARAHHGAVCTLNAAVFAYRASYAARHAAAPDLAMATSR